MLGFIVILFLGGGGFVKGFQTWWYAVKNRVVTRWRESCEVSAREASIYEVRLR